MTRWDETYRTRGSAAVSVEVARGSAQGCALHPANVSRRYWWPSKLRQAANRDERCARTHSPQEPPSLLFPIAAEH